MKLGWAVLNLLQAVVLCVWTAFWISLALVLLLVTLRRDVPLAMARKFWAPGLLFMAGARIEVDGGETVTWGSPYVFVSNHASLIDIPVLFVALKNNLRFVAKRELAFIPFLGWYMWATGMIFVHRGRTDRAIQSLRRAGERIRQGASILGFPEGTRSRDGSVGPFKKGAFVVALESGVPVVPVAVEGTARVLSRDGFHVRPGTIRVRIGTPIPTSGLTLEDRNTLVDRAQAAVARLHDELMSEEDAPRISVTSLEASVAARPARPSRNDRAFSARQD
jgi:1-acyl-sn-glycerol-3-phosphate acyltransferase